jgi:hypothetical protein
MADSVTQRIAGLDFNQIRNNLKNYLQTQDVFRDYNFEGSALSSLLDVLAYNTHYNAYYLNMVHNEMFLDTAITRSAVISHAKALGYTPKSRTGATANVNLAVTPENNPSSVTIPKYTKFNSAINGINYSFVTTQSINIDTNFNNNLVIVNNVQLKEGDPLTYRLTVNSDKDQRFIIPNLGVDHTTINVVVQESSENTRRSQYQLATDIFDINPTSNVYFIQETSDLRTELVFGDGNLGYKPKLGNIIIVDYIVNSGILGNGAEVFSNSLPPNNIESITVTLNSSSTGGSDEETLDSIKFNAPRHYETQNRAVTFEDYKRIIKRDYPYADSVIVFGGEDKNPPEFGKVFIGIKPKKGLYLTDSVKENIANNVVKKYNLASILPELVDIDYTFISPTIAVSYDSRINIYSNAALRRRILTNILSYSNNDLQQFGKIFRLSNFSRIIDDTDNSILGNRVTLKLKKNFVPNLELPTNYVLNFNNAIDYPHVGHTGSVVSTGFTYRDVTLISRPNSFFEDIDGRLIIYSTINGVKTTLNDNAGTVDYSTGQVIISSFLPITYSGNYLEFTVIPDSTDIISKNEQILLIEENTINLELNDVSVIANTN